MEFSQIPLRAERRGIIRRSFLSWNPSSGRDFASPQPEIGFDFAANVIGENHVHRPTPHIASCSPRACRVDRRLSRAGDVLDDGRDHEIAGDRAFDSGQWLLGVLGSPSEPCGMDRLLAARHDSAVVLVSRRRGAAVFDRQPAGSRAIDVSHVGPCVLASVFVDLRWACSCAASASNKRTTRSKTH